MFPLPPPAPPLPPPHPTPPPHPPPPSPSPPPLLLLPQPLPQVEPPVALFAGRKYFTKGKLPLGSELRPNTAVSHNNSLVAPPGRIDLARDFTSLKTPRTLERKSSPRRVRSGVPILIATITNIIVSTIRKPMFW